MLRGPTNGRVFSIIGGQWGSEGKGAAAAFVARLACGSSDQNWPFDIACSNAGAQAGHTSVHNGKKRVTFHLPTYALIAKDYGVPVTSYLTAGSIIDPVVLWKELDDFGIDQSSFFVHPNAAVITDECRAAEMREDSAQTKIASTRKGVGEAYARKALRSGLIARDCSELKGWVRRIDLNGALSRGRSVFMEVPQGFSLSVNSGFYPHTTSRICTVQQALADGDVHPSFAGDTMMVVRTHPIRVGNIAGPDGKEIGNSGGFYHDQREIAWTDLGVEPEITTVTKRVRRVFTFSQAQIVDAMKVIRPTSVMITFCNYFKSPHSVELVRDSIFMAARSVGVEAPTILYEYGPTTDDVTTYIKADPGENNV